MTTITETIGSTATKEVLVASACVVRAITVTAPAGGPAIITLYDDDTAVPAVTHGATVSLYYGKVTIDGSFENSTGVPVFTEDDDYEASTGITQTNSVSGVKLYSSAVGANSASVPAQGAYGASASTSVRYAVDLAFVRGLTVATSINDAQVTVEYTS